ncbi:DUF349 domain-containing protein [Pseudoalteromonas sp. T1lg65]|uniref:DUF349 domain-containing protein n=1 Tax=Pseudoalteromonas sp. T1lg65 TaxID=2077101 RepID=UPI003F7B0FB3
MIFKHLFTPKWKHPKSEVRSQAIDKLDLEKDANVLHTMALEDDSAQIRKKVLNKVNDLGLWWKAYKQDQDLKELAEQKITSAVVSHDHGLQEAIRNEFIDRYASNKVLEKVALAEQNTDKKVKLLKRLSNATLIEKQFKEGDETLQLALFDLVVQHQLINSAIKSAKGQALEKLNALLEQQRLEVEMPKKVAEQTRIVLAKLNALRDKYDYQLVSQQAAQLNKEWQAIELKWLDEESTQQVDSKYTKVSEKLNRHIDELKQTYDAQQAALQVAQNRALEVAELTAELEAIEQTVSIACKALNAAAATDLSARLAALKDKIAAPKYATTDELSAIANKTEQLDRALADLPNMIAASEQFTQALTALEAIKVPNELSEFDQVVAQQKDAFVSCKKALDALPKMLAKQAKARLKEVSEQFMSATAEFREDQETKLKQAKKKARDVQRLIDQGRFKVAFGVFKGFMESYEQLTEGYKKQVEKQYESLSEALQELKDWQKYAATPKRAELLASLDEKLQEQDVDPAKRAEEVKLLRVRWNELGHVESEEEKQQAQQFDEKIEQLFAPCREYFAQQEALREEAKLKREAIIAEIESFQDSKPESADEWRELESQFNRLSKAWKSAGNVDAKVYQKLNKHYRAVNQNLYDKLKGYHEANAVEKAKLVEIAAQQLSAEDLVEACATLKTLQKQWQQLGFAGAKQEHNLWKAFRAHNDAVFAKRSEQFEQQKAQQQTLENEQRQQLADVDTKLIEAVTQSELNAVKEALIETEVLPALKSEKSRLLEQVNRKLDDLFSEQRRSKLADLLTAVAEEQAIPASWQGKNQTQLAPEQLLLRLEILTNLSSPESLQAERMSQQVAMLDAKLQGEDISLENYIVSYLAALDETQQQPEKDRLLAVLNA